MLRVEVIEKFGSNKCSLRKELCDTVYLGWLALAYSKVQVISQAAVQCQLAARKP